MVETAIKKYITTDNLKSFLNNSRDLFATKTEMDTKSDKSHIHSIVDITSLKSTLDGKAPTSHGTHVGFSEATPTMDGFASVGTAVTVARSDHQHPTDTSRAAQTDLDIVESLVLANKAAIEANALALKTMQTNIDTLAAQVKLNEENLANFVAVSSQEINTLF